MVKRNLVNLAHHIQNSSISTEKKKELIDLINSLENEIQSLNPADQKKLREISQTTFQTTPTDSLSASVEQLRTSVEIFEASHPRLISLVNNICVMLSNIGI